MDFRKEYEAWCDSDAVDEATKKELLAISDNPKEMEERFYKNLAFGTAGLRGVLGAGTNRMNLYVVRKATQGLATYIASLGEEAMRRGVCISYDTRRCSDVFSREAARVLAANGVHVYLFKERRPVPELSFAIRALGTISGIMITASHNPPEYNGYKVYWEDGGQLPPAHADEVLSVIEKLDIFKDIRLAEEEAARKMGLIHDVGEEMDEAFLDAVEKRSLNPEVLRDTPLSIVYTPLHGTGLQPVTKLFARLGFQKLEVVREQAVPDPDFSTVVSPNPENPEGFTLGIAYAKKVGAELILGTDPDADRLGVMVKDTDGSFKPLSGNQIGILLTHYILSQKKEKGILPENGAVIKSVVTSEIIRAITEDFGVRLFDVFTGFKYIGEKMKALEEAGEYETLFAFEESYGYLIGPYAHDKDGVGAAMMVAEMAAFYKKMGLTLFDALKNLYETYGYYEDLVFQFVKEGRAGQEEIAGIMRKLREEEPKSFGRFGVMAVRDYLTSKRRILPGGREEAMDFPKADVLTYEMGEGMVFSVRPSGTEPKIKLYFCIRGETKEEAEALSKELTQAVKEALGLSE